MERTGADLALDKIFKASAIEQSSRAENPEQLNILETQASKPIIVRRKATARPITTTPIIVRRKATARPITTTQIPSETPTQQAEPTVGQKVAEGGRTVLETVSKIVEAVDNPVTFQYAYEDIKKKEVQTSGEQRFIELYEKERPLSVATEQVETPSEIMQIIQGKTTEEIQREEEATAQMRQQVKGFFAPSEELKQAYNEAVPMKQQIIYSATNPLWYVIPGAVATKASLAKVAVKGGAKGAIAKIGAKTITPIAKVEEGISKLVSLPIKGTGRLVYNLRRRGNEELTNQVVDIVRRAKNGEAIEPKELLPIVKKSAKVSKELNEILRNIKIEQTVESVPDYTKPLWTKLTPARKRGIVKSAGLTENVSTKQWVKMTDVEKSAINKLYLQPEDHPVVQKVIQALDDAKIYQAEQKFQRAEVMSGKGAILAEELAKATTPEEVAQAQAKALTGKLPKVRFEAITPDDGAELWEIAQNSPVLQYRQFDKTDLLLPYEDGGILMKLQHGELPTDSELQLLGEVFGKKFSDSLSSLKGKDNKVIRNIIDATNLPRALMSSMDLSALGRQAIIRAWSEPKIASRTFVDSVKAFGSEKYFQDFITKIRSHPLYGVAKDPKNGLGVHETFLQGSIPKGALEEPFISRLGRKIWGVKQSARAFDVMVNGMRFESAYKYLATKPQLWDANEMKWLGRMLNWETGRGPLPQSWLPALNSFLFSPALVASRIATPSLVFVSSPAVRKMAIGNMIKFVGGNFGILTALKMSGAIDWEVNPTSTDFGKIRVGNTRLDLWGGFQQYLKLFSRLATGKMKISSGEIVEVNKLDETQRFALMKLAPFPSFITDLLRGETVVGDELTTAPADIREQAIQRLAPFTGQDIYEAIQEDGWTGALVASPTIVGVGATSYPSRTFADWLVSIEKNTGKDWTQDQIMSIRPSFEDVETSWLEYLILPGGKVKELYRKEHPEIDASLYFWGETSSLANPVKSRSLVQGMLDRYDLTWDVLPIRPPTEPYERKGKSDEEVIMDIINLLPSDIAEYINENPDVLGDRELEDYINNLQTLKLSDSNKIGIYEIMTYDPDTKVATANREKYRKENPDVDAALNFWRANVKSLLTDEAERLFKEKGTQLGIPEETLTFTRPEKKEITVKLKKSSKIRIIKKT